MKFQTIIILLLFLTFSKIAIAQDSLAWQLLKLEEQLYDAQNDTVKNNCVLEKFNLYISQHNYNKIALSEARRVDYKLIENAAKRKCFLWNASIVAYMNTDLDYANYYHVRYTELSNDTSINKQFLEFLINEQYNNNWDSSLAQLTQKDTLFSELICLKKLTEEEDKKNKYMLASAFLPGLGSALLGYPVKGAVSLSINTMIAVLMVNLVRHNLWFNTVFFGGALIKKFYAGNIRLSSSLYKKQRAQFKENEASACAKNLELLLKKYPLTFKYYQPIPKL